MLPYRKPLGFAFRHSPFLLVPSRDVPVTRPDTKRGIDKTNA